MSVFIIAEVGINHNGDIDIVKEMVDEAKKAGADCVKFQTFKGEEFISDPKQTYTYISQGTEVTESMLEMFKRYEFTSDEWIEIVNYCKSKDIVFSSTAQNKSDLEFLLSITDLTFLKIGSDDLTNIDLIKYYASKQIPMIISAGMSYAYEVEDAVRAIREVGNENITVLHCISSYPTDAEDVNLKKIQVIKDAFNVKVGFSDHTIGSASAVGSVCFGAEIIEKHFTLDKQMAGPDHRFSINSKELKQYVDDIRYIEVALGNPQLVPTSKELSMREIARRKIVAKEDLLDGDIVSENNIEFKRNENKGIEPKNFNFILNRKLNKKVQKGCVITLEDLT